MKADSTKLACSEVRKLADAYVDRELFLEATLRVRAHLRICRLCEERIDETARLKYLVRHAVRSVGCGSLQLKIDRGWA